MFLMIKFYKSKKKLLERRSEIGDFNLGKGLGIKKSVLCILHIYKVYPRFKISLFDKIVTNLYKYPYGEFENSFKYAKFFGSDYNIQLSLLSFVNAKISLIYYIALYLIQNNIVIL